MSAVADFDIMRRNAFGGVAVARYEPNPIHSGLHLENGSGKHQN